jgi:hypothetical protein
MGDGPWCHTELFSQNPLRFGWPARPDISYSSPGQFAVPVVLAIHPGAVALAILGVPFPAAVAEITGVVLRYPRRTVTDFLIRMALPDPSPGDERSDIRADPVPVDAECHAQMTRLVARARGKQVPARATPAWTGPGAPDVPMRRSLVEAFESRYLTPSLGHGKIVHGAGPICVRPGCSGGSHSRDFFRYSIDYTGRGLREPTSLS